MSPIRVRNTVFAVCLPRKFEASARKNERLIKADRFSLVLFIISLDPVQNIIRISLQQSAKQSLDKRSVNKTSFN